MATKKRSAFDVDDFRRQSEKRATQNQADLAEYTPKLLRQLICELRVRQTELEMQIEELGCKQMELYASYKRYFDSYQLAPAGLLTLDSQSMIVEANLAFSTLLDVGTGSLAGQKLTSYILPEDQNLYDLYSEQLLATGGSSVWRMRLVNQGGSEIWVRMEATLEGESAIRAVVSDITDRVQEEQSLQERELQFRQLFELSSDALLLIDGECGQIIEANGAAVGLYGYSRDALIGMKYDDISAKTEKSRQSISVLIDSEKKMGSCFCHQKKDGTIFFVEVSPTSSVWKNRQLFILVIRDISDRKKHEVALAENEQRFREVLENSIDAAYKISFPTFSYDYLSPVITRIIGYTVEELKSFAKERLAKLLHPEDRNEVESSFCRALSGIPGTIHQIECRFQSKLGQYVWLRNKFKVSFDESGKPEAIIGTISDITENRRVADVLRKSEEIHKKMISNIIDVIAILDRRGTVIYTSPNIEKCFGWLPDECIGTNGWEKVHSEDLAFLQTGFVEFLERHNQTETDECRFLCKDGNYKYIELTTTNLLKDPVINGLLVSYHDITARKHTEEKVRRISERFQNLAKRLPIPMSILDSEGNFLLVNDQFTRVFGYTIEEVPTLSV